MNESMRWDYVHDYYQRKSIVHDMEILSLLSYWFFGGGEIEAKESNSMSAALNFCSDPIEQEDL